MSRCSPQDFALSCIRDVLDSCDFSAYPEVARLALALRDVLPTRPLVVPVLPGVPQRRLCLSGLRLQIVRQRHNGFVIRLNF